MFKATKGLEKAVEEAAEEAGEETRPNSASSIEELAKTQPNSTPSIEELAEKQLKQAQREASGVGTLLERIRARR